MSSGQRLARGLSSVANCEPKLSGEGFYTTAAFLRWKASSDETTKPPKVPSLTGFLLASLKRSHQHGGARNRPLFARRLSRKDGVATATLCPPHGVPCTGGSRRDPPGAAPTAPHLLAEGCQVVQWCKGGQATQRILGTNLRKEVGSSPGPQNQIVWRHPFEGSNRCPYLQEAKTRPAGTRCLKPQALNRSLARSIGADCESEKNSDVIQTD